MPITLDAVPFTLALTGCAVFGACVQAFYTRYLAEDDVHCTDDEIGLAKKIWDVVPAAAFMVLGLIGFCIAVLVKPKPKKVEVKPKPTVEETTAKVVKILEDKPGESVSTEVALARIRSVDVSRRLKDECGIVPGVAIELTELVACDGIVDLKELSRLLSQSLSSALFIGATVRLLRERMDRSTQSQLDSHAGKLDAIEAKIQEVLDLENTLRMTTEEAKHEIINQQGVYREDLAKDIKGTMLCPGRQ